MHTEQPDHRSNGRQTPSRSSKGKVGAVRFHRLVEVRRQEGVSRRCMARRMGIPLAEVKLQEQQTNDIPLSVLYQWQKALQVPVTELLAPPEDSLSLPLLQRAQMVQMTKTAVTILERAEQPSIRRLARTLIEQMAEIMPELRRCTPWPGTGRRRKHDSEASGGP